MLVVMYALIRSLFHVPFEWGRLTLIVVVAGGLSTAGELLLPTAGAAGFLERTLVLCAIPLVLWAAGFLVPGEAEAVRRLTATVSARRAAIRGTSGRAR
jgi:hypothetical protein